MVKPKFLIDSVIIIDHLNAVAQATKWLVGLPEGSAVISPITRAEVLSGARDEREEGLIFHTLDIYACLVIDQRVADIAATIRKTAKIKLPDAIQAALAQVYNLKLATRNTKDFKKSKFPSIVVPYKL
jgi:predicted nucleic acid-binding protein